MGIDAYTHTQMDLINPHTAALLCVSDLCSLRQANWFAATAVPSPLYFLVMSGVRVMLRCLQGDPAAFLSLPVPSALGPDSTVCGPFLIDPRLKERFSAAQLHALAQCVLEWALVAAACAPGPVCSEWWRVVAELSLVGVDVSERIGREAMLAPLYLLLQAEEQAFVAVHRARRLGPPRMTPLLIARFCLDVGSRECFANYRVWMRLCLVLAQLAEEGHNTFFDAIQAASLVTSDPHVPITEEYVLAAVELTRNNLQTSPTALRPAVPPTPQKGARF
jgi:hypothetical protein